MSNNNNEQNASESDPIPFPPEPPSLEGVDLGEVANTTEISSLSDLANKRFSVYLDLLASAADWYNRSILDHAVEVSKGESGDAVTSRIRYGVCRDHFEFLRREALSFGLDRADIKFQFTGEFISGLRLGANVLNDPEGPDPNDSSSSTQVPRG